MLAEYLHVLPPPMPGYGAWELDKFGNGFPAPWAKLLFLQIKSYSSSYTVSIGIAYALQLDERPSSILKTPIPWGHYNNQFLCLREKERADKLRNFNTCDVFML